MTKQASAQTVEMKRPGFFYGYVIVLAGFFIQVVSVVTQSGFGIFFEPLVTQFGWTRAAASAAMSVRSLVQGIFTIVSGRLTDRFGPRLIVTFGCLLLVLGLLALSRIDAIWQLYLFYGITAVGGSSMMVPLIATVGRWFVRRRGLMTGAVTSAMGIGTMIMPPIVSWLISTYGWRSSYVILGLSLLPLVLPTAQLLRRDPSQVGLLPYGSEEVKAANSNLTVQEFSFQEAIRTIQFWMIIIFHFFTLASVGIVQTHIVIHATGLGLSPASSATILTFMGAGLVIGVVMMSAAADRINKRLIIAFGFVLFSGAFLWVIAAKEVWMLYLFGAVIGLGQGAAVGPIAPLIVQLYGLKAYGTIMGTAFLGVTIGGMIGPFLAGYVFDVTGSYQIAFITCAATSITGIILALLLKPHVSAGGRNDSSGST